MRYRKPYFGVVGHAFELNDDSLERPIYSDATPVPEDASLRRPCVRCGQPPTELGDDPCIACLPGTKYACCGHGDRGYVQLQDGRSFRFIDQTGETILRAVLDVLTGKPLPLGFVWDAERKRRPRRREQPSLL